MKIAHIFTLVALSMIGFQSCDDNDTIVTSKEGGLIEIKNPSINYVVGNPGPYTSSVRVYQGAVKTTKLEIYKTFNTIVSDTTKVDKQILDTIPYLQVTPKKILDTIYVNSDRFKIIIDTVVKVDSAFLKPVKSNTVLFKTIDLAAATDQNSIQSFNFTFDELKKDLKVEGKDLPVLDGDYRIGDNWELSYKSFVNDGRTVFQNTPTKVTVATRYAGKYRLVKGYYYRIGVLTDQGSYWPEFTLIESIDAKTYKMNGLAAWPENKLFFQIDGAGKISYPATWDGASQLLNSQPLITVETNPVDMKEVKDLPNVNMVIKDDVNGKDQLIMAFGYYTAGSGPRTFYQVMEKIVE